VVPLPWRLWHPPSLAAFLIALVGAATLLEATPLPAVLVIVLALTAGAAILIGDILLFKRPASRNTRLGRRTLGVLLACTAVLVAVAAFEVGRLTQPAHETYPFVANGAQVVDFIYFAPTMKARSDRTVAAGTTLYVDCYVHLEGGDWYRIQQNQGWLTDQEFLPAAFSGEGSPPRCPG